MKIISVIVFAEVTKHVAEAAVGERFRPGARVRRTHRWTDKRKTPCLRRLHELAAGTETYMRWSDVIESRVTIRSPFCGYSTSGVETQGGGVQAVQWTESPELLGPEWGHTCAVHAGFSIAGEVTWKHKKHQNPWGLGGLRWGSLHRSPGPVASLSKSPTHALSTSGFHDTIRYDTRCYFNVRSKADISQLNLPHGTDN